MTTTILEKDKVNIRLPDGLRNRIKAAAAHNGRSLNNEIVVALLERFPEIPPDAKAIIQFMEYVAAAEDDLERVTRAAEVEAKLRLADKRAHLVAQDDGSILFRLVP